MYMGLARHGAEDTIDFLFPGRPIRLQQIEGRATQVQQGMTSSHAAFLWFAGPSAVYHFSERKATAVWIGSDTIFSRNPLVRWGGGFLSRSGS